MPSPEDTPHLLSHSFRQLLSLTPEQLDDPDSPALNQVMGQLVETIRQRPPRSKPVARALQTGKRLIGWLRLVLLASGLWGCSIVYAAPTSVNTASIQSGLTSADTVRGRQPDSVDVCATQQYTVRRLMTALFGHHYRAVWSAVVRLPVLDLRHEAGGLEPLQQRGGMQTLSLRLQGGDGKQYMLRSINKNTQKLLPATFQGTLPAAILQDQISASHPYGALVVPPLANAAGILHTTPRLVWVPADTALGQFRTSFGETVALLEERPESDGHTQRILNTRQVFAHCRQDNHHRVDQQAFLRARLFDMWLGDWDRHEDQWRWAAIDSPTGTLYRPIPRDRDQAFARYDGLIPYLGSRKWYAEAWGEPIQAGLIPYLGSRKWASRRFQTFKGQITDVKGLNFNARRLDRLYLTELNQSDWEAVAGSLQRCLTDSVIETAVRSWPPAYTACMVMPSSLCSRADARG